MKLPKPTNPKNMYTYHIKEMVVVSKFKKNLVKFCVCAALFLLGILITLFPNYINQKNKISHQRSRYPTDLKYILFWEQSRHRNPFRREYFNEFENGQKPFVDQKCTHINCYISYNKSLLDNDENNFDAVVFDVHGISKFRSSDVNLTRSPDQIYVFRSHESAEKQPVCNPIFDEFFNWTWTYKLDSNIPHPFVSIYDVNNTLIGPSIRMKWVENMTHSKNTRNKIGKKTKAVAWIVTRCKLKNKHKDFVNVLKNELNGYNYTVDIFGPCGEKKCPNGSLAGCYKMVEKNYYFQMVLEDSFSQDYVGENMVKALSYFSVPIVLGGADYARFLSPGSYIDAKAFDIKKLGALIDFLIKNPVMYQYFFDWKNHYFYTVKHRSQICDLCSKLNNNPKDSRQTWTSLRKWWNTRYDDICQRMHLLKIFNS